RELIGNQPPQQAREGTAVLLRELDEIRLASCLVKGVNQRFLHLAREAVLRSLRTPGTRERCVSFLKRRSWRFSLCEPHTALRVVGWLWPGIAARRGRVRSFSSFVSNASRRCAS